MKREAWLYDAERRLVAQCDVEVGDGPSPTPPGIVRLARRMFVCRTLGKLVDGEAAIYREAAVVEAIEPRFANARGKM